MNDPADDSAIGPYSGIALAAVGFAAGYVSGFFGIGGGLVLVPALMILCRYPIKRAVGISLVTIIGVSVVAVLAELGVNRTNIQWTMAVVLTAGSLAGSLVAGRLLTRIPETPMRLAFAGCLAVAAYRMSLGTHGGEGGGLVSLAAVPLIGHLLAVPVGVVAGLTSTLFGLGGGIVTVPGLALIFRDVPFHAARATSLVTIVPTSALGAYQHQRMGTTDVGTALRIMPTAVVGAILGVVSVNLLPTLPCRLAFAVFLVLTALRVATLNRAPSSGPFGVDEAPLAKSPPVEVPPLRNPIAFRHRGYASAVALVMLVTVVSFPAAPPRPDDGSRHLALSNDALAKGDVAAAVEAWHDANHHALASRRWESLVEIGDAARLIADRSRTHGEFVARARQAYLGALFRARRDGSLEGVLRTAEAFLTLGDRQVVEQSLRIAADLAAADVSNSFAEQLHALEERLAGRATARGAEGGGEF